MLEVPKQVYGWDEDVVFIALKCNSKEAKDFTKFLISLYESCKEDLK